MESLARLGRDDEEEEAEEEKEEKEGPFWLKRVDHRSPSMWIR